MNLTRLSIRRPLTIVMAFAMLAIMGMVAVFQLPIQQLPNVNFPVVQVQVSDPGASSSSVLNTITTPLQEALSTVSGVTKMVSTSGPGASQVSLTFAGGTDITIDANEVSQIVSKTQGQLPSGISPPSIIQANPFAIPIMTIDLSGKLSASQLYTLASTLVQPQLQQLPGVGQISLVGGAVPEVNVLVDPNELAAYGLSVNSVTTALSAQNLNQASGTTSSGTVGTSVITSGLAQNASQLGQVVVGNAGNNPVLLGQVAMISQGLAPITTTNTLNGTSSVGLVVTAQSGANAVAVDAALKSALAKHIDKALPPGVHVTISGDSTVFTLSALEATATDVVLAILLASLVILVFLQSWRQTIAVAVAIPTALLSTFLMMDFFGFSLDLISLLAISLLVGILVDDGIVVLENITRHFHMGKDARTAAYEGRMEIGAAAVALTLTDVVVYLPVAFVSGNTGQIFREFGITVAVATLFSLLVSFTLTPMLASRLLRAPSPTARPSWATRLGQTFDHQFQRLTVVLERLLRAGLAHKPWVLSAAVLSLVGTIAIVATGLVGTAYIPPEDTGLVTVNTQMPPGTTIQASSQALQQLSSMIRAVPGVTAVQATAGVANGGGLDTAQGSLVVDLVPKSQRADSISTVEADIRKFAQRIPGLKANASVPTPLVNPGSAPIAVILQGPDMTTLNQLAVQVTQSMTHLPGLVGVQSQALAASPAWNVQVNQVAASHYGLTTQSIGKAVNMAIQGSVVTTVQPPNGIAVPIRVTVPNGANLTESELATLPVGSASAGNGSSPSSSTGMAPPVTLGEVATIEPSQAPLKIQEYDQLPQVTVQAHLQSGTALGAATQEVKTALSHAGFPPGYSFKFGGQVKQQGSTFGPLLQALGLSIILMFMLLVALYQSWITPLTILFALPLASVGAMVALAVTGQTLNLFSLIGLIMLVGLVGKNGILLVDYTQTLRDRGVERLEAVIQAACTRMRPILMTTLTMVIAMLPLAISASAGSEYRSPMALVIIGGLTSSTFLTLLVVPVFYIYLDDLRMWWRRVWSRGPALPAPGTPTISG